MIERIKRFSCCIIAVCMLWSVKAGAQADDDAKTPHLQPREEFKLDLPKITVCTDYITDNFEGVRISFAKSNNQILIGTGNDMYIKNSSRGSDKTLYSEPAGKESFLSKFEVKTLRMINKSFIKTLENFDRLLQKKEWAKCRYLDIYFPNFLKGYYYFIGATRNTPYALPRSARVPEDVYDVSQNSPKTDRRIRKWQIDREYTIKLRIAARELAYQLGVWQRLLEKKRSEDIVTPKEVEESLIIFVRVYFSLKPPSPIVTKKYRD